MRKKLFILLLAVAASVGTMFAESGTCGDNLTWDLTDGELTISGTGTMTDYYNSSPWYSYRSSIKSVTIGNSVTSIGINAFTNCSGMTSVTIGNSTTSIGNRAFSGCSGLTSVTIPNSVTSIGDGAFSYCSGLTSMTIPNSVTSIGSNAFTNCSGMTSVTIGNSIESIGRNPFSGCYRLSSVIWNAKNCADFSISVNTSPFYDICSNITSFTFGEEVEYIPAYLCYNMSYLTSIIVPNSVRCIGEHAFASCSSLTSVTIPNSVFSIGDYAFSSCVMLTTVNVPAVFFNFPESGWALFAKNIQEITVNGGTLTDDGFAVINRSYKVLKTLDLSAIQNTTLADEAFKECYNLENLYLPTNLNHIGYMSVAECVKLKSIDIPSTVTEIDDRAFEDCRSLKSITFGGSPAGASSRFYAPAASASQLKRIGSWAFYNAHELQDLVIPEGVEEIGDGAFYGCTYMEDLVLPASVQSIGDNTFALCSKLQKITVNSVTPPSIQAKTFYDVKRQIPVYVPDDAVTAYEGDIYWSEFDIQGVSQVAQGIKDVVSSSLQGGDRGRIILRDGQIFILRGEKTYTVTGQEVR